MQQLSERQYRKELKNFCNVQFPKLIVTIPAMNEFGYIQSCIESIKKQTWESFYIIVCVNQPDHWWKDSKNKIVCENNERTLSYLKNLDYPNVEVIDRSSPGKGLPPNNKGVGDARNLLFEKALEKSEDNDLIMCLDADTTFDPGYFQSVIKALLNEPDAVAHSNPYYHKLTGEEAIDKAILRYELYMRLYVLNLWRIESPYAFTPLGSNITMYAKSLKDIGKIAPKPAGEDFYLLQKLRKHGRITQYNEHYVYPSSRTSGRVPFGTGPAVTEIMNHNRRRYPVYPVKSFNAVKETYNLFPVLFDKDVPTPMDDFFQKIFGTKNIFYQLRKNFKSREKFIRACHIKIDGLRILQFIKEYQQVNQNNDVDNLQELIKVFFNKDEFKEIKDHDVTLDFNKDSLILLKQLRDKFTKLEQKYRKQDYYEPKLPF